MKKATKISLLLFGVLILFSSRCKKESNDCQTRIKTINNTNRTIYVDASDLHYPDTIFVGPTPINNPEWTKVEAFHSNNNTLISPGDCWETKFNNIQSGVLSVYVFDSDTLNNILWDTVKVKSLYLKRYDLTLQNLKDRNWTITYP